MLRRIFLPALFLVACTSLPADVTMRMSLDMKVNMAVPGAVPQLPFKEILTRIKGDRSYATLGTFITVTDNSRSEVTLIDTVAQRYTIVAMADYMAKVTGASGQNSQNMPDAAKQILANMKFDIESHDTGRFDHIGGIDVFEREVVINMSIPVPIPGQENGMQMSMRFQMWKPKPAEFERVPALRELATYADRNLGFNNPTTMLRQLFSAMPGMSDHAGKMAEEIAKGGNVTLGMHVGVFMPGLAKMMEQARAKGATVPDLPAGDTPLAEVNFGLKELSTGSVPDDVFVIPAGYKEAPLEDLVKGMMAAFTGAKP
jgi:hypothetical protein